MATVQLTVNQHWLRYGTKPLPNPILTDMSEWIFCGHPYPKGSGWTSHLVLEDMAWCAYRSIQILCNASSIRSVYVISYYIEARYVHDGVIKWKHFPRHWPFVRGIHRSPVNSPHNGQWRGALIFSFICVRTNGWVNSQDAGDFRRHHAHYYVTWCAFLSIQILYNASSIHSMYLISHCIEPRYVGTIWQRLYDLVVIHWLNDTRWQPEPD